jgi:hypothetical protein
VDYWVNCVYGRGRYVIVDIEEYEKTQAALKLMSELEKGRISGGAITLTAAKGMLTEGRLGYSKAEKIAAAEAL